MQHTTTSIKKKIIYQLFQQLTRYFFFSYPLWDLEFVKYQIQSHVWF